MTPKLLFDSVELHERVLASTLFDSERRGPVSSYLARRERRLVRKALIALGPVAPADMALAEHLSAQLEAAGPEPDEAVATAIELALAYHEGMICEPAALAQADGPQSRIEAIRGHLAGCRTCRAEFAARVVLILSQRD